MSSDIHEFGAGQKPSEADKLVVAISESITGHRGKVTSKQLAWPKLCQRLAATLIDSISSKQFYRLPEAEQHNRKNQGYFVGGQFEKGVRKITALQQRSVVTLDIDKPSLKIASELLAPFDSWLSDYEHFTYTTRSHTPESPRLRVIIPLAAPIDKDKLDPLTRIIASKIDPEMETVDPVSFRPAQIMYYPSTNRDGEFRSARNRGKLLDADAVLAEFGAWENYHNLPRSPREKDIRKAGDKVQDPREKRGMVGAFCRTYDIHEVIEKYLAEIYEPGEMAGDGNDRYSYLKGSATTKNGAIVYEDGRFLFSHHGTDPCGGTLKNSFDLWCVHTFGHLDKPEDLENDDPRERPSYKAAIAWLQENDPEVMREFTRSLYDQEAMADDAEFDLEDDDVAVIAEDEVAPPAKQDAEPETPAAPERDWMDDLDRNEKGGIKSTLHNIILILRNDKRFRGALRYNEFTNRTVVVRRIRSKQYGHDTGPILNRDNGDSLTGRVLSAIRAILEGPRGEKKTGWGLRVSDRDIEGAVEHVAHENSFHPIRHYIRGCGWDGVPRLRKMLHTYWGVEDNLYHAEVGFLFMIGAVARIFEPGCKFDFVMILEGPTGVGKSTSMIKLAPSWVGEFTADPHKTDKVIENLQGNWILELPELTTFLRSDSENLKALFSATKDQARLAYGRVTQEVARQCVFYGTTNNHEYFRDQTGNRRYWPVRIPEGAKIDLAGLERDRDLLWAEAREEYFWYRRVHKTGTLPLYLTGDAATAAVAQQGERMVTNDFQIMKGVIHTWLETAVPEGEHEAGWIPGSDYESHDDAPLVLRDRVCVADVMRYALHHEWQPGRSANGKLPNEISQIMQSAKGWMRVGISWVNSRMGAQLTWKRIK